MRDKEQPAGAWVVALATQQHAVVALWQLRRLGFSRHWVARRVAAGWLHPLHRAVYLVGPRRITANGRWMAAVLACGPDAVLSHGAAVALWGLRPRQAGPVDVTVPRSRHARAAIRVHMARALTAADRAVVDGIPVTSLPRTLLDYAGVARPQELGLAIEAAERRGLLDVGAVELLLARSPGRPIRRLREVLAELSGPAPWTQSELERRFIALVRDAGLPEPHANVAIAGHVVDFHWPAGRLVAEVDGYEFHRSRHAFERDRKRDAALQLAGVRVLRVTHRRMHDEPKRVISELRALLSAASGP